MYSLGRDGTILRHYDTHARAYARDLSPNFVWVSFGRTFAKFDLQQDIVVSGPYDSGVTGFSAGISGIAIVGDDVAAIPALSPLSLAFLALTVAISAIVRLRT